MLFHDLLDDLCSDDVGGMEEGLRDLQGLAPGALHATPPGPER